MKALILCFKVEPSQISFLTTDYKTRKLGT
jgi:hypothetical protein